MCFRALILSCAALLTFAPEAAAKGCLDGTGTQSARLNEYTITIRPDPGDTNGCVATVGVKGRKPIFRTNNFALEIDPATGRDIDGDGLPDVVITGYAGGAHCCWTYSIVSVGPEQPGLLREICNDRPASFEDLDKDGKIEIVTIDGSFDYFDGMSHGFSPFPPVVLQLAGRKLSRLNERFPDFYLREINAARAQLKAGDLVAFKNLPRDQFPNADWELTKKHILTIVLAKLYMGRKQDAQAALHQYWPTPDEKRMRGLILGTARKGFLRDVSDPKFGCLP